MRAAPISLLLDGWEHIGGCKASAAWGNHGTQQSSDGSMKQEEAAKLHRIKQVCAQGNEVFVQSRAEKKKSKNATSYTSYFLINLPAKSQLFLLDVTPTH